MNNTNVNDKNLRLANALEHEKNNLPEYNVFWEINDKTVYDDAIAYLRTGIKPLKWQDNDLLSGCVEDIETMYLDYGIGDEITTEYLIAWSLEDISGDCSPSGSTEIDGGMIFFDNISEKDGIIGELKSNNKVKTKLSGVLKTMVDSIVIEEVDIDFN